MVRRTLIYCDKCEFATFDLLIYLNTGSQDVNLSYFHYQIGILNAKITGKHSETSRQAH